MKIAGVRFKENWKVYDFDASDVEVTVGDRVIVESERGLGFGKVMRLREASEQEVEQLRTPPEPQKPSKPQPRQAPPEEEVEIEIDIDEEFPPAEETPPAAAQPSRGIKRVLRKASEEDFRKEEKNRGREQEAFTLCQELIGDRELPMKLIRVEYSFDASRATFFFFSETRVDFRELVRDLAHKLRARIEMRQIGVRDVARLVGGFGPCGRQLCCASFLRGFEPVSIRMAKKQEMVLNPAKISGVCGRLLCCLSYEYEYYDQIKKDVADLRDSAVRDKKEEERRRIEENREVEQRRLAEDRKRQEEQRQREKAGEGRQRPKPEEQRGGRRPDKKGEAPPEKKTQQPGEQRRRQDQHKQEQKQQPSQKPEQKTDQKQEPQQGEKPGQGRGRHRFWRKRKKKPKDGKPQRPGSS